MLRKPVEAVLFDMDGLLLDTEVIYIEAMQQAARSLGREMALDFCHSMVGVPAQECSLMIEAYYGDGFSIEEFRVGVANPNAAFGRGSGGQASVISRRGTNDYHGLLFWYHQNDNLNAATWTAKRTIAQTVTDPVQRAKQQERACVHGDGSHSDEHDEAPQAGSSAAQEQEAGRWQDVREAH